MTAAPLTGLGQTLSRPDFCDDLSALAEGWFDQTVQFRLEGAGRSMPVGIGAHLRRSFLGAMGAAASAAAQRGEPCSWDPPCAFDVFCREQLRGPRGDGLPKPYVLQTHPDSGDLIVGLRVIGMANDWFMAAAEGMVAGINTILPWSRLYPGRVVAPPITSRVISQAVLPVVPAECARVRVKLLSPLDVTGADPFSAPHKLLSRLVRRVDALSRWNGLALEDTRGRELAQALQSLNYDTTPLHRARYDSPNAKGETRRNNTVTGAFEVSGPQDLLRDIWPALVIGERCHLGRGAREGLGWVSIRGLGR